MGGALLFGERVEAGEGGSLLLCLFGHIGFGVGAGQGEVRLGAVGCEADGFFELGDGLRGVSQLKLGAAQNVMGVGGFRSEFYGGRCRGKGVRSEVLL